MKQILVTEKNAKKIQSVLIMDWCIPVESYRTIADALLFHTTHTSQVNQVYFDRDEIGKVLEEE